jgi:hypothetical protein
MGYCKSDPITGKFTGDNKVECVCQYCGNVFVTYRAWVRKGGGKYCSKQCCNLSKRLNKTTRKDGYIMIKMPDHPRSNKWGFVYQHIIVAEEKIGRPLNKKEVVHHLNGNPSDNHPDNLFVFNSQGDHAHYHLEKQNYNREYHVHGN